MTGTATAEWLCAAGATSFVQALLLYHADTILTLLTFTWQPAGALLPASHAGGSGPLAELMLYSIDMVACAECCSGDAQSQKRALVGAAMAADATQGC